MAWPLAGVAVTGLGALLTYAVASGVAQGVAKAVVGLGIGYVAYQGADLLVSANEDEVFALLNTMPPLAVSLMGVLKIGTCVKIMFSAMVMRLSVFGLNEGMIKRFRTTGAPSS
jgi:hypothetical protein